MSIATRNSGGLANRLKPLVSCLRLGRLFGRDVQLCWPKTNECHCEFTDLFACPISQISETDFHSLSPRITFGESHPGFLTHYKLCTISHQLYPDWAIDECCKWILERDEISGAALAQEDPSKWVSIPHSIREELSATLRALAPQPFIAKAVDEFMSANKWDEHIVGVHARRTDLVARRSSKNLEVTSDEALFRHMSVLLGQEPKTRFLMATDCEKTEHNFLRKFGSRMLAYPKRCRDRLDGEGVIWREKEAVQDALVDLLLLARCGKILGSKGSTFSTLAQSFWGAPLEIVH